MVFRLYHVNGICYQFHSPHFFNLTRGLLYSFSVIDFSITYLSIVVAHYYSTFL
nr:MAG TPA: hypothetical protein [Caudoviricetes sp.]